MVDKSKTVLKNNLLRNNRALNLQAKQKWESRKPLEESRQKYTHKFHHHETC